MRSVDANIAKVVRDIEQGAGRSASAKQALAAALEAMNETEQLVEETAKAAAAETVRQVNAIVAPLVAQHSKLEAQHVDHVQKIMQAVSALGASVGKNAPKDYETQLRRIEAAVKEPVAFPSIPDPIDIRPAVEALKHELLAAIKLSKQKEKRHVRWAFTVKRDANGKISELHANPEA